MADQPNKKARPESSGPPPVYSSISDLSRGSKTNEQRYENLVKVFKAKYGSDPKFIARAPGRVNIIGEHIDYSGYAVLPMAIEQDIAIACSPNDSSVVNMGNTNPAYPEHKSDLKLEITGRGWYNYVLSGMRGIKEFCSVDNMTGMDLMIDGSVPPASGLSSSSALVCAAALTTAYANKISLPSKTEFAELSAKCERYCGMEGGGMDQAISFLGEDGKAMLIEFNPVRSTEVTLPEGCVFVIANTLVPAEKAAEESCYNVRVAECRLASVLIAKQTGLSGWENIKKLLDLQVASGRELSQMSDLVSEQLHSAVYTREEICGILEISDEELKSRYLNQHTNKVQAFSLHDRAKHVYKESDNVYKFKEIANSKGEPEKLGKLMDDSHFICRTLYECSCPELDEIVGIAKSTGALGSRLTGAGWGGCVVSLARESDQQALLDNLKEKYFDPKKTANLEASLFVTKPGAGAALCNF